MKKHLPSINLVLLGILIGVIIAKAVTPDASGYAPKYTGCRVGGFTPWHIVYPNGWEYEVKKNAEMKIIPYTGPEFPENFDPKDQWSHETITIN